jgi:hypothetical protein
MTSLSASAIARPGFDRQTVHTDIEHGLEPRLYACVRRW